jgi:hypothetical protein
MLLAAMLIGLSSQPVMADRIDDIAQWANKNFKLLFGEVQTLKQMLNQEQKGRDEMSSELRREQWEQQKRNIDTFHELRERLTNIERQLHQQEQIIKNLAAQR